MKLRFQLAQWKTMRWWWWFGMGIVDPMDELRKVLRK